LALNLSLDDTSIDFNGFKKGFNFLCVLCVLELKCKLALKIGDGDLGLTASSCELGSGGSISEGKSLHSSDVVGVCFGFWDSLNESWVLSGLVEDFVELLIKFSTSGGCVVSGTNKEFIDVSSCFGSSKASDDLGVILSSFKARGLSGVVESDLGSTSSQCCANSCSILGEVIPSSQWCDGFFQLSLNLGLFCSS